MIILSPIYLLLIIAIKVESKGPILFTQKRVGLHKKHFNIYKFRTMRIDTPKDTPTHLLDNPDQYITKVGKFLRSEERRVGKGRRGGRRRGASQEGGRK